MSDSISTRLKESAEQFSGERSEESKVGLADNLSHLYATQKFSAEEKTIADAILEQFAHDIFVSVRRTVSNNLKNSEILPRHIALALASDVEEVSVPMIEFSSLLTDEDLISIIKAKKLDVINEAVIRREALSPDVSEAIIDETSSSEVVVKLLKHQKAAIEDSGYGKIVERFSDQESIALAMYSSSKVPQQIINKYISKASDLVRDKLRTSYPDQFSKHQSTINIAIARSWELSTLSTIPSAATDKEIFDIVLQLRAEDKLTPSLLIMSLCIGHVSLFQMSLAALTKSSFTKIVESCKSAETLTAVYEASHLPASLQQSTVALYGIITELNKKEELTPGINFKYVNLVLEKITEATQSQEIPGMDYVLSMINRNIVHTN